ncbi:MAG: hypothetical protein R3327_05375 [Nitrosopumilaceae archaeon]|nr:hypothetical protein [Nitrosopumilaceae archaeon]
MKRPDKKKTLEIIEKLKTTRIGEYKKWQKIAKKIKEDVELNPDEYYYIATLSRTYGQIKVKSRIYHTRLSDIDEKQMCKSCGNEAQFYCNMNDEYFCSIHVVGHDENEL